VCVSSNGRPAVAVQRHCHSVAVSADVDVLSPVPPTPSAVAHALPPACLAPARLTLVVAVVQFEPGLCPPQVGPTAASFAAALSPDTLCAVEPLFAAL